MKKVRVVLLAVLSACVVLPVTRAQVAAARTPPAALLVTPAPVREEALTYSFEVAITTMFHRGQTQMVLTTTIVKSGDGQTVKFRDIRQVVSPDASTAVVSVDGKQFAIEAAYTDVSGPYAEPRSVSTTYGVMFSGGRVGVNVRRSN